MEDETILMERMRTLDGDTLDSMAELATLLKICPGIGNSDHKDYRLYHDEVKERYRELRDEVPQEYDNAFLFRCGCREFG